MKWLVLAPLITGPGTVIASGSGSLDPSIAAYLTILQVPVFGALAWALLTGRIRTRDEMDRVIKERDEERNERIQAQNALQSQALPAVVQLQETMKQATEVIVRLEDRLSVYEAEARLAARKSTTRAR